MRRKITVYGLRFSKTSFWNRLNTGFPDPAVATVLTACGIETFTTLSNFFKNVSLQQYLPLAVLKLNSEICCCMQSKKLVATVLTACGIETIWVLALAKVLFLLQQYLPLAVLKLIKKI